MKIDRVFFAPGPLAIGKGLAYLLAFCTALVVANPTEEAFYYGIIVYCCGCICDYIENAMGSSNKSAVVQTISLFITIVLGIIVVLTISLLYSFDSMTTYVDLMAKWKLCVGMFFSVFWTLPLACGIILCLPQKKKEDEPKPPGRYALGYTFMP